MNHHGALAGGKLLAPFANALLSRTLVRLWRLHAASADGSIPLLGTLVLESTDGFITLCYSQAGVTCAGPSQRAALRWDVEPELTMGHTGSVEEWLDLMPMENQPIHLDLPITVTGLTGWFGTGPYIETFAIALRERSRELLIATTAEFELVCIKRVDALTYINSVVTNMNFALVEASVDH